MAKVQGLPVALRTGITYAGVIQGLPDGNGGGSVRIYRTHKVKEPSFKSCYSIAASAVLSNWGGGTTTLAEAYIGLGEVIGGLDFDAFYWDLMDAMMNDEFDNTDYDHARYD